MKKKIRIGNKNLEIKSSAYTMFGYKDFTGRDLMADLNKINNLYKKTQKMNQEQTKDFWLSNFNSIFNLTLELAYTLAKEADDGISSYKEWLSSIDNLMQDPKWIKDVLEVGMSPFRGKLQNNQHDNTK